MISGLVLGLVAGAAAGTSFTIFLERARSAARAAKLQVEHATELGELAKRCERLGAELDGLRVLAVERDAAWEHVRTQLAGEFSELSARALQQNNSQFLELADARLKQAQQRAEGDLDQRKQAIESLVSPLKDQLGKYEEGLRRMELERKEAYSGLSEQVKSLSESQQRLQAETKNLVTALRAPATRGRWGEMQLRRVVEMAGMIEHCDFEEQVDTTTDEGRVRPDMVVHLPGSKRVVVDAKVPLQAFLDADDATDEESRRVHMASHARQLRQHVDSLSKKAYWRQVDGSVEYVVAFVPGDPLLAAALAEDATLYEYAASNHVLLATPTSLIALLRTAAFYWRQEALAQNARLVEEMGCELYRRLVAFAEHLARVGKGLGGAVDAYNKAVGSLERSVLPQARRFEELGVLSGAERDMPELSDIDSAVRQPSLPDPPSLPDQVASPPLLQVLDG